MNIFLKDIGNDRLVTWDYLIDDINNSSIYNSYCKSPDYYTVFKQIILTLLIDEEIILLDSDFTESELINLTGYSDFEEFIKPVDKSKIPILNNQKELLKKLNNSPRNWKITLFTSGTTGTPKKVCHDFKSITRFVKATERNKKSVWGFAYNPTHMAGIQVFFQALLNGNTIIRLFGLNTKDIYTEITNNAITHISATPTFYRLLLPYNGTVPSVERITSGGEKFNEKTFKQLNQVFPNAKITNVYASTEAGSLFASKNDIFSLRPEYESLVHFENNELLIHKSLMGRTETSIGEWYKTGDVIEIVSHKPLKFRFVNRKSEMINIGGYKVNPLEVEEAISTLKGINNVRVYSKPNSVLGNIVCCEVVANRDQVTEISIRKFLQSKIQEFKIPRLIQFVDSLSTTRTGKLKR
ncbi:AMP-binding protein [Cyclobacterium xiamenense]|uniref:AMP-binding protein n=1 Tax=Cyclobacterium xiamenense TaxID=1297121 RepID=UPI0012B8AF88|nr:AMP-binding protein [Cyclobacterium xiamenense]